MSSVLEQLLIAILRKLVTPDVIKDAEKSVVAFLKELAKKSDNKVDDFMVQVIAEALGVPY